MPFLLLVILIKQRHLRLMIKFLSAFFWAGVGGFFTPDISAAQSISQLINQGQIEAAHRQLEQSNPSDVDRLFFRGQVLKAKYHFAQAVDVFREVLRQNPQHLNARRELAHTLLLAGQYNVAKFHFDQLLEIDRNETMRGGYRHFLNVIAQNKPTGISGYFTLLPSTNINRGTTNTVFDTALGRFVIDPNAQATSGVGVGLGISGYLRHPITPESRLLLNLGLSGNRYADSSYNSATGSLSVSYERITGKGRWFLTPYTRYTWREDDAGGHATGLRFSLDQRVSNQNHISFSLSHEYRNYPEESYRDGGFTSAQINPRHQISASLSLNGGIGIERSTPNATHLRYDVYKLFGGLSKIWKGGFHTSFGIEAGRRDFVGNYPLTTSPRDDAFYELKFGIYNTRINYAGFAPRLFCSYINNHSNVAFYDYNATECQIILSKNF